MTDRDAFLAAIIADADSDVPRLVFADWLEEHGDTDRAEFIRLQCSLVRDLLSTEEYDRTAARVYDLLTQHRHEWRIPNIPGSQTFHRGFVDQLHISAEALLEYHSYIERAAPVIELRLSATDQHIDELVKLPIFGRLRSLDIRNDNVGPRLRSLFRANLFPELRTLTLRNNRLWAEYVAMLTQLAHHLPKLERLDLSGNPLGDEGLQHLANSANVPGLRELVLRSDDVDEMYTVHVSGATSLAKSKTLTQLRGLQLTGQNIGDGGLIALIQSPNSRTLRQLDVSRNGITGAEWAAELVRSPHVAALGYLDLSRNEFDSSAVEELVVWPQLANGCRVDLRGCGIDDAAWRRIVSSSHASQFILDSESTT